MKNPNLQIQSLVVLLNGVIATLTLGALPVFIARISEQFALDSQQTGFLASADLGGCALGCVIALSIIKKHKWRSILIFAIIITLLGNFFSILSSNYIQILCSRSLAGIGNGFIVSLVFSALSASANPDRNFGLYTFGQLIAQSITLPLFSYLVEINGINSIFIALIAASTALLFVIHIFPKDRNGLASTALIEPTTPSNTTVSIFNKFPRQAILSLAGLAIYFLGFSALWAFFDPIGQHLNLSDSRISGALGIASLIGILGPILVVIAQPIFQRNLLLTAGILLHISSIAILLLGNGYSAFLIGTSVFIFSLNFVFPLQMGQLATFDEDGSIAVSSLIIQLACLAIGPIAGGMLFTYTNQTTLLISVMLCFFTTIILFLWGAKTKHASI